MHCELQHELQFMQSGVAGDLHIRGSLELKLINTRDIQHAVKKHTQAKTSLGVHIPLCISGKCTWDR